jgi:hypothetical protein
MRVEGGDTRSPPAIVRQELSTALRDYLAAARTAREEVRPPAFNTAAEFRRWFKAHPPRKTDEE